MNGCEVEWPIAEKGVKLRNDFIKKLGLFTLAAPKDRGPKSLTKQASLEKSRGRQDY